MGRLYRRGNQDGDSLESLGQDFDAAGPEPGFPEDRQTLRGPFPPRRAQERQSLRQVPARRHALRGAYRHARLQGCRARRRRYFRLQAPAFLFGRVDSHHQRIRGDSGYQVVAAGLRVGRGRHPFAQREFRARPVPQGRRDYSAVL